MSVIGKKTWGEVDFNNILNEEKKKKPKRIIGLTFPECDISLGLEPSVLNVLPQDDKDGKFKVEYSMKNIDFNDDDVLYYMCSVYISGVEEFEKWAMKHDTTKIIVGGYHPTTFPEDFKNYAFKIVQGPCDEIFKTIEQYGQIVQGICEFHNQPRLDLYDVKNNYQIIPDAKPDSIFTSINTSIGCPFKCDFCCSPMMCSKLQSNGLGFVHSNLYTMKEQYKHGEEPDFLFIRDENFPLQKDWKDRLYMINYVFPNTKLYLFASANLLKEDDIKFMKKMNVYMICLGLEDVTESYNKNENLDNVCKLLRKNGIYVYLSFIVNPVKIVGSRAGIDFYDRLLKRLYELKPEMICGNFLMPFRGTKIWNEYYWLIDRSDYKYYNSKSAFLVKNKILREKMEFFMFYYQWKYYNSDTYKLVRDFHCGDTLNMRFLELSDMFEKKYDRIWNRRA